MSRKRRMKRRLAGPQRPSHLGASSADIGANFLSEKDAPYAKLGASLFPGAVDIIDESFGEITNTMGIDDYISGDDLLDLGLEASSQYGDYGQAQTLVKKGRVDTSKSGFLSGFSTLHYAAMAAGAAALVYFITKK